MNIISSQFKTQIHNLTCSFRLLKLKFLINSFSDKTRPERMLNLFVVVFLHLLWLFISPYRNNCFTPNPLKGAVYNMCTYYLLKLKLLLFPKHKWSYGFYIKDYGPVSLKEKNICIYKISYWKIINILNLLLYRVSSTFS